MKPISRWLGVAAAGWLLLGLLLPRFERNYRPRWSRQQAIAAAMRLASDFGIDATGWQFSVSSSASETGYAAQRRYPESELLRHLSPSRTTVTATAPGKSTSFHADFFDDGTPARWSAPSVRRGGAASRPVAEEFVLDRFAGLMRERLEEMAVSDTSEGKFHKIWRWSPKSPDGVSAKLDTVWRGEDLLEAEWKPEFSSAIQAATRAPGRGLSAFLETFRVLWTITAFIIAGWYMLVLLSRRRDHLWFALRLLIPYGAVVAIALTTDAKPEGLGIPGALALFPLLAGGFVLLRGRQIRAWLGTALLGSRRWRASLVGRESLTGWVAGPLIACVPYAVAALWPGAGPASVSDASWPWARGIALSLAALFPIRHLQPLALFAALAPWLLRGDTASWWRRGLFAFAALALLSGDAPAIRGNAYLSAVSAALSAGALYWLYRRAGLLATFAALVSADLAVAAWVAGWSPAVVWLVAGAGFLALFATGTTIDETDLASEIARRNDPPPDPRFMPERQRLQTEFGVAAEVQRDLLPAEPPAIPGYSVASLCRPAREVGGDLYDFAPLPDGRWLLCVADVSGKGVPASLYMTLTKGMLAAEVARTSDLLELCRAINRHLYLAGRRRTFVTMALVAVDPRTNRAEVIRAGHNPPLVYERATGRQRFLHAGGLGLGLAPPSQFDGAATTEALDLAPGDILLLYSDGLTEAMNTNHDQFGEDRMEGALRDAAGSGAAGVLAAVEESVDRFTAGAEPHDDLTIVVLKRDPVS